MKEKYGKPQQFSDPHHDWYDCPERLQELIEKKDNDLNLEDFGAIFSEWLPAADYEEGLYYIPLCFGYMSKMLDPVATNICTSIFWYIAYFKNRLKEDGYYADCLKLIRELVQSYTDNFELIRLSDDELEEYVIDKRYREMPRYCRSVYDLVDCLIKYEEFWDLLLDWIEGLAKRGGAASCWCVDIASHVRWWHILYREDDTANGRKEELINRLHRFGEYKKHWYIVSQFAASKKFYEYNRRVSIT
jgi:hypothetical protein